TDIAHEEAGHQSSRCLLISQTSGARTADLHFLSFSNSIHLLSLPSTYVEMDIDISRHINNDSFFFSILFSALRKWPPSSTWQLRCSPPWRETFAQCSKSPSLRRTASEG